MLFPLLRILLLLYPLLVLGQAASIPQTWTNTTTVLTRDQRIALAQSAIDRLIDAFPLGSMVDAINGGNDNVYPYSMLRMLSIIARKDRISMNATNAHYVTHELDSLMNNDTAYRAAFPYDPFNNLTYALACADAYSVYGGATYMSKATNLWAALREIQLTDVDVSLGQHDGIGFAWACDEAPLIAGSLPMWYPQSSIPPVVFAPEVLEFASVSARLAQLTHGNSTFGSAANASLQFWHQTLVPLSPVHGCAAASLTLSAGAGITPCGGGTNPSKFATNYACEMWSAEGYSLLSSVTGNTSTSAMPFEYIKSLMTSRAVLNNGKLNQEFLLNGGTPTLNVVSELWNVMVPLADTWNRSVTIDPASTAWIEAFATMQMNALLDNSTVTGSSGYGVAWPLAHNASFNDMTAAAMILTAAIGPYGSTSSTTSASGSESTTPSTSSPSPAATSPSRAIWAAIGATVAVVALLFLLVGYFVLRARRRRQRQWHERNDPRLQPTPNLTHQSETVLVPIGEKQTMMVWRDPAPPFLELHHEREPSSLLARALQRKEDRMQTRAIVTGTAASSSATSSTPDPSPAGLAPEDAQQLPRYVNSLPAETGDEPVDELSQRLAELGSIPQVLQALQNLIRHDNTAEPALPQYDESRRSGEVHDVRT